MLDNGVVLELAQNFGKITGTVQSGKVLVDGLGVGDVGNIVLRDRKILAEDGLIIVVVTINKATGMVAAGPDIVSRGFVYVKDNSELMLEAEDLLLNLIANTNFKTQDWNVLRNNIRKTLTTHFYKKLKRRPMILPIIIETK